MREEHAMPLMGDASTLTDHLKDTQQYIKELRIQHGFNALSIAGLVAVVIETFSFLLFGQTNTEWGIMLYKFSLLIGPSALFLLLLHLYELHGMIMHGEKSIPLTLDLMYFLYICLAFPTMAGVQWYYQRHMIPSAFVTPGGSLLIALLCSEVLLALFLAKYLIARSLTKRLPHFFMPLPASPQHSRFPRPVPTQRITPKHINYFRRKPDVAHWEHEDCFVRLNQ
jgi:hypothetical protein